MNLSEESPLYCIQGFANLRTSYLQFHPCVVLTLCILGTLGNLLNVVVFTRLRMRSPINITFTALAVLHLVLLIESLTYVVINNLQWERESYGMVVFNLFHINCGLVFCLICRWLLLAIAVWDITEFSYPYLPHWYSTCRAVVISVGAFLVCSVICIPLFITFSIDPGYVLLNEEGNRVNYFGDPTGLNLNNATLIYQWKFSEIAMNEPLLIQINEWVYGILLMIIPCVILVGFCSRLIIRRRRRSITDAGQGASKKNWNRLNINSTDSYSEEGRIKMLLWIFSLFVIFELPRNVLNILKIVLGQEFAVSCILPLNEMLELSQLFFPAITVFIYCKMNEHYWSTIVYTFKPKFLNRWWPEPQETTEVSYSPTICLDNKIAL